MQKVLLTSWVVKRKFASILKPTYRFAFEVLYSGEEYQKQHFRKEDCMGAAQKTSQLEVVRSTIFPFHVPKAEDFIC